MDDKTVIFDGQCTHLRAVAYRLLGSEREAGVPIDESAVEVGRWLG